MRLQPLTFSVVSLASFALLSGCGGPAPEPQPVPVADASAWCPALAGEPSTVAGGVNPSVGGEDVPTDLVAIAAALPQAHAGWLRTEVSSMARGAAGHWSPVVLARYASGEDEVLIEVNDLVHVCTCAPGMGAGLRDARGGAGSTSGSDHEVAGYPASVATAPVSVELWVNDRCSVHVHGAVSAERMTSLVEGVDYAALSAACPARF